MYGTGLRNIWYTIIRKPNIRQKKGESDEEFFNRMVMWYDEEPETKIKLIKLTRTDDEVEKFVRHAERIANEIANVTEDDIYQNTAYCTKWGRRCEYAGICLNYDPNVEEYVGYFKDERRIDYGVRVNEVGQFD